MLVGERSPRLKRDASTNCDADDKLLKRHRTSHFMAMFRQLAGGNTGPGNRPSTSNNSNGSISTAYYDCSLFNVELEFVLYINNEEKPMEEKRVGIA